MIQRYVLREIALPVLAWLGLLVTLMWTMSVLKGTDVLLGSEVTAWDFARVSLYLLPHFVAQAAPVAFLLGLLIGFGRLSEDKELVALQSFGLAPRALWLAPLGLAVVMSALLTVLAFGPQPHGLQSAQRLAAEIIKRNLVGDVKPGVFHHQLAHVTLYVERVVAPGRWGNVLVYDERTPSSPVLLLAKSGRVVDAPAGAPLELVLEDGALYRTSTENDDDAKVGFERATLSLGVEEAVWQKNRFRAARDELTPLEMLEAAAEQETPAAARPLAIAAHWKLGQVLMPVSFALLGVPLGLRRRTSGRARGAVFTLLGYATFYVVAQVSTSLGEKGLLAPLFAGQLANLLFIGFGLLALVVTDRGRLMR
ncbi:MAG: LptF/LptG family permease [Myxococcaceae bacterium]|nr:LptF/LptG family permease [Myxococcaceae bacterium]